MEVLRVHETLFQAIAASDNCSFYCYLDVPLRVGEMVTIVSGLKGPVSPKPLSILRYIDDISEVEQLTTDDYIARIELSTLDALFS